MKNLQKKLMNEKMEMIKQHRKNTGKNVYLEEEKRKRSNMHQKNNSQKPVVFRGFLSK